MRPIYDTYMHNKLHNKTNDKHANNFLKIYKKYQFILLIRHTHLWNSITVRAKQYHTYYKTA